MSTPAVRRSSRPTWANYTSFGRDYLADALHRSRPQLDEWLLSNKVHPHLVFWHSTCIEHARRFNEGVEWINTGSFFTDCDLEEDVLLLCLEEGNQGCNEDAAGVTCQRYTDVNARTYKWTTVELWARTVWRIVQDNCGPGAIFEKSVTFHPAKAYGIVFDMLSLAFHNIASIGLQSVWATIINSACNPTLALTPCIKSASVESKSIVTRQMALDADPDAASEVGIEQFQEVDGYETDNDADNSDFSSDTENESESVFLETPKRTKGTAYLRASPTAPVKACRGTKQARSENEKEESPSKRAKRWIDASLPNAHRDNALKMFGDNNVPITGYHAAGSVQKLALQQRAEETVFSIWEDTSVLRRDSQAWS